MRALLTSGIKAILAIAALSTAAHWALRVQRESPSPVATVASVPEPTTTGSIEPRRLDRPAPRAAEAAPAGIAAAPKPSATAGLDQSHLAALIAGATPPKPKAAKAPAASTRTASADRPATDKATARR